ncbi:MAG TPA: alpha/beta hydrolase [Accumulibacter sp.]|uniref:alpha/beta hydrolase n=1 Tax=Accumulibacter sp. TaxID=2053492 RepID=UPI0025F3BA0D|nr:alpha/beta hydrolase [Accumulibacter sp.]MCM8598358.1 alpha/beta fold hydrolase [Accumulibacter sp.]MCM8663000.1 alpha/beta fold hydrolase [Accumulibacter sp.]HNC50767.1 alpha/beta hydrolase [Accumulibacter sp.]
MPEELKLHPKLYGRRGPKTGYSHLAKAVVCETTRCVQKMHGAIAGKSFGILRRIPLISGPAGLVQSAHDTIAGSVYTAIQLASRGLFAASAIVEGSGARLPASKPPGRLASGLRSVINGAFGDLLAESDNRLAISMAIRLHGATIPLAPDSLRSAFPEPGQRLCVFLHGLSCDEHFWDPGAAAAPTDVHFGRQLRAEFDYTPLYLRYNTGLPIAENGVQLARLLDELLAAWPQVASEVLIVGHSMGGLIALAGVEAAAAAQMRWPQLTRMLICLGSPHLGSPVERLGQLTTLALNLSSVTAPLGEIAARRSQGIKDLRSGPGAARNPPAHDHIAFRFLGASLAEDSEHPFGRFFGDGLVTPGSATAHAIDGDVEIARLGGLGHMRLLTDERVYRQIREWVAALHADTDRRSSE